MKTWYRSLAGNQPNVLHEFLFSPTGCTAFEHKSHDIFYRSYYFRIYLFYFSTWYNLMEVLKVLLLLEWYIIGWEYAEARKKLVFKWAQNLLRSGKWSFFIISNQTFYKLGNYTTFELHNFFVKIGLLFYVPRPVKRFITCCKSILSKVYYYSIPGQITGYILVG